ncbi:NMCC_0638 family (lipo)protein [Neisseria sp. S1]|uniref:NMCC_0638 family (lipo)protein n=1 Tax=Neisseria sp. S1 TaxID=3318354 RepID=UPI003A87B979
MKTYGVLGTVLTVSLLSACNRTDEAGANLMRHNATTAIAFFAEACIGTGADLQGMAAWARQKGWHKLEKAELAAQPFGLLAADAKNVWLFRPDKDTAYYLSGDGNCRIQVTRADADILQESFAKLALQGRNGVQAALRAENYTSTPFPFTQKVYSWWRPGSGSEVLLTANTSVSDFLPAQAALDYREEQLGKVVINH